MKATQARLNKNIQGRFFNHTSYIESDDMEIWLWSIYNNLEGNCRVLFEDIHLDISSRWGEEHTKIICVDTSKRVT